MNADVPLQAIRFKVDVGNRAFSKLEIFPVSFPSIPNFLISRLAGVTEAALAGFCAST